MHVIKRKKNIKSKFFTTIKKKKGPLSHLLSSSCIKPETRTCNSHFKHFPGGARGKEPACQCKRHSLDPWIGKFPGEVNGNPLQYTCLKNPMDKGVWQATVRGLQSQTWWSDWALRCTHTRVHTHTHKELVTWLCWNLCDPMDSSLSGSSVHGIS